MQVCPVCSTKAKFDLPQGDYESLECPKCGRFKITGTALAMLEARISNGNKKAIARLSHSIRCMSNDNNKEVPVVNSVNLDTLVTKNLPNIENQMKNLLIWASDQLGDDFFGAVDLPHEEFLTAIVGAIDGSRVDDLISSAKREGLIDYVPDHAIRITPQGWARLKSQNAEVIEHMKKEKEVSPAAATIKIIDAHCNNCGGKRNSSIRASYTVQGDDGQVSWSNTYDIIECCGCNNICTRHTHWFSEWDSMDYDAAGQVVTVPGTEVKYFPAPTKRGRPEWSDKFTDPVIQNVLDETYEALNSGLNVLSSIGVRTLLDRAGFLIVGDVQGGFEGKLSALEHGGHISAHEKTVLEVVADAGSASAHRGYAPDFEKLNSIVDIIENFLHRTFLLRGAAEAIKKSTPPRPVRMRETRTNSESDRSS